MVLFRVSLLSCLAPKTALNASITLVVQATFPLKMTRLNFFFLLLWSTKHRSRSFCGFTQLPRFGPHQAKTCPSPCRTLRASLDVTQLPGKTSCHARSSLWSRRWRIPLLKPSSFIRRHVRSWSLIAPWNFLQSHPRFWSPTAMTGRLDLSLWNNGDTKLSPLTSSLAGIRMRRTLPPSHSRQH